MKRFFVFTSLLAFLMVGCSFFPGADDASSGAKDTLAGDSSAQASPTPKPLEQIPPEIFNVGDRGGSSGPSSGSSSAPTPTPGTSAPLVSPADIIKAYEAAEKIRSEVDATYEHVAVTAARITEMQPGALWVSYLVMFTIPEKFLAPATQEEEEQAGAFTQQLEAALVDLLRRSIREIAPELSALQGIEILVVQPDGKGLLLRGSIDTLADLPDDAAKQRWFSRLGSGNMVFVPTALLQKIQQDLQRQQQQGQ